MDLKVKYTIGRDTPPIEYIRPFVDFTVKTAMSCDITLEITTDHKRRHSVELAMSKNAFQARQKLRHAYDPAVCALTAEPEMVYESGKVKINAPIGAAAGVGPFAINVQTGAPNHMSGSLSPPTLNGALKTNDTVFKFSANISLSAEVTWHPVPKGRRPEPARVTQPLIKNTTAQEQASSTEWGKVIKEAQEFTAVVALVIMGIAMAWYGGAISGTGPRTTSIMPFTHTIDRRRHEA